MSEEVSDEDSNQKSLEKQSAVFIVMWPDVDFKVLVGNVSCGGGGGDGGSHLCVYVCVCVLIMHKQRRGSCVYILYSSTEWAYQT